MTEPETHPTGGIAEPGTQESPGPAIAAALGVLLVAAVLRVARVSHGLPDFLEEAFPLRRALDLIDPASGRVHGNPHFFNYPSLSIYVHFAVQSLVFAVGLVLGVWKNAADYVLSFRLDPTAMVMAARSVGILVDLVAIVAVMRIAERLARGAGWVAGLIAAVSPLLIVTSSSIFCDGMMAAAGLWAVERALAWSEGRARWPAAAAVLIGLAAGAMYPGALLLLPLLVAMLLRDGPRALARWLGCAALALGVFLATTPFAVLAWPEFLRDLSFEREHAAIGHLGSAAGPAALFFLRLLVVDLGGIVVLAAAAATCLPALARRAPRSVIVVLAAAAATFAPIALSHIEADRDLVPTVFVVAALAAASIVAALERSRLPARLAMCLAALAWPSWVTAQHALESPVTTQLEARRWCESNLPPDALLVQEGYGIPLVSRGMVDLTRQSPEFAAASQETRDRIAGLRTFRVVALPLAASGRWNGVLTDRGGLRRELPIFERAGDMNRIFYEPALFAAADYFVTSSSVHDRLLADSARVPEAAALYRLLEERATVVARFEPHGRVGGPRLALFRLEAPARAALAAAGPLDPMWWTRAVPADYRERVVLVLGPAAEEAAADGGPPPWVTSLRPIFASKVGPFATEMAAELGVLWRFEDALPFALAIHQMMPEDVEACALASVGARRSGAPDLALRVLERTRRAAPAGQFAPELELETARACVAFGRGEEGARLLDGLVSQLDSLHPVRQQAIRERGELARRSPPPAPVAVEASGAEAKVAATRPGAAPKAERRATRPGVAKAETQAVASKSGRSKAPSNKAITAKPAATRSANKRNKKTPAPASDPAASRERQGP